MKQTQFPQPYLRGNGVYYFSYYGRGRRRYKSTSCRTKTKSRAFIRIFMENLNLNGQTFAEYAAPFFIWEKCPHVRRLVDEEGKSIGRQHVAHCRSWLERFILSDPIGRIPLTEIIRADVLDFRGRLVARLGDRRNTANKVISVLKIIFHEAYDRGEIAHDATYRLGKVKQTLTSPGTFRKEELVKLFPEDSLGPWAEGLDYTVFLVVATTGMRRGEVLALQWRDVDLSMRAIHVRRAWKAGELGTPKWGKLRSMPLPALTVDVLRGLREQASRTGPEDLVFSYGTGHRLGDTWWVTRFRDAMKEAGIDWKARRLKPHSFRHTLNSLLIEAGESAEKIRAALGWSSEAVQRDFYTHVKLEGLRDQAEAIEGIFNGK